MTAARDWLLFFAVCLGLGYPTLNRYDPRRTEGTSDSAHYAELVTGWRLDPATSGEHAARVLVPYAAKPFYRLAEGRLGSWDPVRFGLLASNSLFCATTALLLSLAAKDRHVGLLAAALYLLNFTVSNAQLSGLVDSGEACGVMAAAFCLLKRRPALLPVVGILGALAKETFVPIAGAFVLGWLWREKDAFWAGAMVATSLAAATLARSAMAGAAAWPWSFALEMRGNSSFLEGLSGAIFSRGMLYSFGWLLPAGLWRLGRVPPGWARAALCGALAALALSAYHGAGGNAARPVFDAAGPLLSLSAALWLSGR